MKVNCVKSCSRSRIVSCVSGVQSLTSLCHVDDVVVNKLMFLLSIFLHFLQQSTFSALLSIINCLHSPSVWLEMKVYRLHCPSQLQSEDQRSPLSIACEGSSVLCVMYILLCGCKCAQELLQTPFSHSRPSVSAWDWFQDTRRYHNPWIPKYLGVRIEPRQNLLCIYILSRLCIIFNKYQCFVNSSYTALFNEYWQGKCIFLFSLYMFTTHETIEDLSVESRNNQAFTAI